MKRIRKTSAEAWKKINDEGLLRGFRLEVYNILYHNGPLTVGEVGQYYQQLRPGTPRGRNECAKRISELFNLGAVETTGETIKCPVTGFNANVWDVTPNYPEKPAQVIKHQCAYCNGKGYTEETKFDFKYAKQAELF